MQTKPILVVMATGMGSRYGGLKQIDPVGPSGEAILDYSLYDARRAGFKTVVFIIKHEIEQAFKEAVGARAVRAGFEVRYAYQQLEKLPEGFTVPEGRVKPWGTAHAILVAEEASRRRAVRGHHADDYYGPQGFKLIYDYLSTHADGDRYAWAMVGFLLGNTVSESVSCGIMLLLPHARRNLHHARCAAAPLHPQRAVRHPVARRGQPPAGQRPAGGGKQPDPLHAGDLHGQPRRGRGPVRQLKGYGAAAAVFPVFGAGGAVRPADARDHPRPHKGRHRRHAPPDFYDAAHDRRVLAGGGGRVCGCSARRWPGSSTGDAKVGRYVQLWASSRRFMYLESMVDGVLKGLGEQLATFRYSLFDSVFRIAAIWLVVPQYGMMGVSGGSWPVESDDLRG